MDKVFEQILKSVPPEILPAIVSLTAVFFGIYYFKGMRSYTDTLNDRLFLTLAVLVIGGFVIWQIQKPASPPHITTNERPLLLVPRFENDVGGELQTLFVTQLRASVEHYVKDATIEQVNAYVRDVDTARLNASDLKPFAVLFEPKVIREGVKTPVLCFRLLLLETGQVTTFSAVPAEPDKMNLGDLSTALVTISPQNRPAAGDLILTRLEALDRKVAELSDIVLKLGTPDGSRVKRPDPATTTKRAIIVGVDFDQEHQLPRLRFAASDAQAMAGALRRYGFEVTLLVNEGATRGQVIDAIQTAIKKSNEDDSLLVYYSGASARSADIGAPNAKQLILPTYDLKLNEPLANLTLNAIVDQLRPASAVNRLVLIDGCHGTYGLSNLSFGTAGNSKSHPFQIVAASQDDQYAFELPEAGGGAFTQKLVGLLGVSADAKTDISTRAIVTAITPDMLRLSGGRQTPKLVTVSGSQDITFIGVAH